MGIWLELGIFLVVIGWGFWQLYDVKQAKLQRMAEEARRAQEAVDASNDVKAKEAPTAVPPA